MAKNTSILLGDYYENFIAEKIKTGRFSSASEIIRTALRDFEQEEYKKEKLIEALKLGEESGLVTDFNPNEFLKQLKDKHLAK
ncbi:antitoxin ParD1/3/4 [Halpernia humi]|uniref:Antitoxin ParD1/3/4 n=1 Tax=Halpernia humi TaxID=493375 RepID=A0A1H6AHB9_9FLAO|nr:type II toxin-antitoxin system ParD family antitoxin [Halpernia humi]SEG48163.1 antitoxin ParD1/3/4 [Halpernia humi]